MSSSQERGTGYQQGSQGQGDTPGTPGRTEAGRTEGEMQRDQRGDMERGEMQGGRTSTRTEARRGTTRPDYDTYDSPAATAGMMLAGTLLVLGGLWGFFVGITGVLKGAFYTTVNTNTYTFDYSVHSWGWTQLAIGCVLFAVGVCLLLGMTWARYVGVFVAVVSAIANFMFLPHYPIWSIIVIAIDLFIIWALLSSGRRQPA